MSKFDEAMVMLLPRLKKIEEMYGVHVGMVELYATSEDGMGGVSQSVVIDTEWNTFVADDEEDRTVQMTDKHFVAISSTKEPKNRVIADASAPEAPPEAEAPADDSAPKGSKKSK